MWLSDLYLICISQHLSIVPEKVVHMSKGELDLVKSSNSGSSLEVISLPIRSQKGSISLPPSLPFAVFKLTGFLFFCFAFECSSSLEGNCQKGEIFLLSKLRICKRKDPGIAFHFATKLPSNLPECLNHLGAADPFGSKIKIVLSIKFYT